MAQTTARDDHEVMERILLIVALALVLNLGCIASWDRAQRALRDLGAIWVRALGGRRVSGSH
jgi:hypothetical protein